MGFVWNVFKFFLLLKFFWFCWFIFLFGWRCNWSFNFLNFCCWFYFINFFILSRCCDRGLNFLNFRCRFRFIDFSLLFINSFYKLRSRCCIRTVVLYLFNCSIDFSNNLLFSCIILLNFLSSINPCLIFNIFSSWRCHCHRSSRCYRSCLNRRRFSFRFNYRRLLVSSRNLCFYLFFRFTLEFFSFSFFIFQ